MQFDNLKINVISDHQTLTMPGRNRASLSFLHIYLFKVICSLKGCLDTDGNFVIQSNENRKRHSLFIKLLVKVRSKLIGK